MDFPEPLFESHLEGKKLCLACGSHYATKALWKTDGICLVPICGNCSFDWNFYGYHILTRIKPAQLVTNILWFKALHPFQKPSLMAIWRNLEIIKEWGRKMKKFIR
jgi:hypothetical protein